MDNASIRDLFAAIALHAMLSEGETTTNGISFDEFATDAYCHADAMMRARQIRDHVHPCCDKGGHHG